MANKKHIDLSALCDDIRCLLDDLDIELTNEKEINYGYQMRTVEGVVINIYVTGKIYFSGDKEQADQLRKQFIKSKFFTNFRR